MTPEELERQLRQFQPSEVRYPHHRRLDHSPGIQFLIEQEEIEWLVCAIAQQQGSPLLQTPELQQFQCWQLLNSSYSEVSCYRELPDSPPIIRNAYRKTAFPLTELQLFVADGCLMLTNERSLITT